MTDRLSTLRLFTRVAGTGSFSRAARELNVSQPTASRTIAELEEDIGVKLFTRTTRALTLTEAGTAYLEKIQAILDALEEANHDARGTGELRGLLRIAVSASLGMRLVIPALPKFTAQHPNLRVELVVDDRRQDLVVEGVDVAFRFGAMADSTAVARRIASFIRIVAASPDYLARRGMPATPADLADHTAIITGQAPAMVWSFSKDGREVSAQVEGQVRIAGSEAAIVAAIAGLGIVSVSYQACRKEFEAGSLVQILPDWDLGEMELSALFASGRAAKPSARAFAAFLAEEVKHA